MAPNEGSPLSAIQPDLEEFLSALNGFLSKPSSTTDPSNIRFLQIFFRSVKSDKGHLLKITENGTLRSMLSYGMGPTFDEEFNSTNVESLNEPTPLDVAFREKDAIAVVDLTKDPDVPAWFLKLMKKYGFVSLVAVPLMGANKPIGILCAYYQDVCLFDQATLGHLMMIGKMVGGATEKSLVADRAESHDAQEKASDQFLKILINKPFTKIQIYALLAKIFSESVKVSGVVCGPLTKTSQGLNLTVASTIGPSTENQPDQIVLPPFLTAKFMSNLERTNSSSHALGEWGEMQPLVGVPSSVEISKPLAWQNKVEGGIVAWRAGGQKFEEDEEQLLARLADIASLALHVA